MKNTDQKGYEAPPVGKVDMEEKEAKVPAVEMHNVLHAKRETEAYKKLLQQALPSQIGRGVENADWTRVKQRLCDHYAKMTNFISTKSQPPIFWLPSKSSKASDKALASTQRALQRKIVDLRGISNASFERDGDGERALVARGVDDIDWSSQQLRWLPESFCLLKSLRALSLSHNRLSSLPVKFGNLSALQALDLQANRLGSLPDSFGDLSQLKMLGLRANRLTQLPESFCKLSLLQTLDARFNRLTTLPDGFGDIGTLREVDFHGNLLTQLPQSFADLGNLEVLHLFGSHLTSLPSNFGSLAALEELDLNGNQLTDLPKSFANLKRLAVLDLGCNQLASLPIGLTQLKSLHELILHGNQIVRLLPSFVDVLESLEVLDLEGNPLEEPPLEICCQGLKAIRKHYRATGSSEKAVHTQYVGRPKPVTGTSYVSPYKPPGHDGDDLHITNVTIAPQHLLQKVLQTRRVGLMKVKTEIMVKTEDGGETWPKVEESKNGVVPTGKMRAWVVDDSPERGRTKQRRARSRPGRSLSEDFFRPIRVKEEELHKDVVKPAVKQEVIEEDELAAGKKPNVKVRPRRGLVEAEPTEDDLDVLDDEGPREEGPPAKRARAG